MGKLTSFLTPQDWLQLKRFLFNRLQHLTGFTISQCFVVTAAAKGARTCLWSNFKQNKGIGLYRFHILPILQVPNTAVKCVHKCKYRYKGTYEIYSPWAFSSTLTLLGHHSPGPLGYKFCKSLF